MPVQVNGCACKVFLTSMNELVYGTTDIVSFIASSDVFLVLTIWLTRNSHLKLPA